jgi:hypothetical protein
MRGHVILWVMNTTGYDSKVTQTSALFSRAKSVDQQLHNIAHTALDIATRVRLLRENLRHIRLSYRTCAVRYGNNYLL